MKTGIELIADERQRQMDKEGWTAEHDDGHDECEMAAAAGVYALLAAGFRPARRLLENYWPTDWADWFKPKGPIKNLVRAGALIAAEIDRRNRLRK